MLKGSQVAAIRKHRGWSQQYLAVRSGVNKAYISEYESGVRLMLEPKALAQIEAVLLGDPPGRWTRPRIEEYDGRLRLVLEDRAGKLHLPPVASVQWTEKDSTTNSIFLGAVETD
jgi:transcriptional regulator with XRE-family HTH domain